MVTTTRQRISALGLSIDNLTILQAIDRAEALSQSGRGGLLVAANLNYAQWANQLPVLERQCRRADLCVADGMSLVLASRWRCWGGGKDRLAMRVTGSDLVEGIAERMAKSGGTLWLSGKNEASAEMAARWLVKRYSGLNVRVAAFDGLLSELAKGAPTFLLLALGQPDGDLWIEANCDRFGQTVVLQIGGALDYLSGLQKRAPKAWGDRGLEWAYRLLRQPRRLGPRYLGNIIFLIKWWLGRYAHARGQDFARSGAE